MEELLNKTVSQDELEKFEKKYHEELEDGCLSPKTQFDYAWCLVRSIYTPDLQKGILLLEDLFTRHPEGKRDYLYYLAIGNARMKQYSLATKYCKSFLQIEPNNQQMLTLEEYVEDKMDKDTLKGMAIAGGAVLAVGGILGIGMAVANKYKSKPNDKNDPK